MDRFTDEFIRYASRSTDCPPLLLHWAGMLALSCALGPSVWREEGDGKLFPNLWLILLGPSSAHKSTALKLAAGLVRRLPGLENVILPNEWSHEKFLETVEVQPHALLIHDEVKGFFDLCSKDYNQGLMAALATLHAESTYRRVLKTKTVEITDAYLCFGGASTPEWLTDGIRDKQGAILSGFLPRFLIVCDPRKTVEAKPWFEPVDREERDALVSRLNALRQTAHGPVTYTDDARPAYEEWFSRFTRELDDADPLLKPFLAKLRAPYSHRLALLAAADQNHLPDITLPDWQYAESMLDSLTQSITAVLGSVTSTRWEKDVRKVANFVKYHRSCPREFLADSLALHGTRLTAILQGLQDDDKITLAKTPAVTRPKMMITWTGNGS